ncbi:MAG TPA: radical SAM protein, partial [Dongiaceae bacterium]|nr:radical SAM protein [Dongiaceae bacterium]
MCFADSSPKRNSHRSLAEVEFMLDALVKSEGEPDLVQISGGEPTIHPQILEVLAAARRRPIKHVMLNTNGIRIAEDPAFCDALAELKPGFEVYLQFDSLNDDALKNIRGAALSRIRRQALANLEARNISTTLVCTVKRGVNDTEIGEIVRHALKYKCVRGINFQPVQDAGRNEGFDPKKNRIVLSDIRRRIVEESGIFADGDMIPLPCNPASISIGYGLRDGEKVIPLTSLVPREALLPAIPNAISFEKYPELRRRFVDL